MHLRGAARTGKGRACKCAGTRNGWPKNGSLSRSPAAFESPTESGPTEECRFAHALAHSLTRSLAHALAHSLTRSLARSLPGRRGRRLVCPFVAAAWARTATAPAGLRERAFARQTLSQPASQPASQLAPIARPNQAPHAPSALAWGARSNSRPAAGARQKLRGRCACLIPIGPAPRARARKSARAAPRRRQLVVCLCRPLADAASQAKSWAGREQGRTRVLSRCSTASASLNSIQIAPMDRSLVRLWQTLWQAGLRARHLHVQKGAL